MIGMSKNSVVSLRWRMQFSKRVSYTHIMRRNSNAWQSGKKADWFIGLLYSCVVHHFAPTFEIDLFGCVAYYIIQKSPVRSDPAISTWMINGSVCLFIHGQIIRKSCRRQFSSSLCLSRPVTPLSSYLINQLIKGDQLSMSVAITFSIFLYKI